MKMWLCLFRNTGVGVCTCVRLCVRGTNKLDLLIDLMEQLEGRIVFIELSLGD